MSRNTVRSGRNDARYLRVRDYSAATVAATNGLIELGYEARHIVSRLAEAAQSGIIPHGLTFNRLKYYMYSVMHLKLTAYRKGMTEYSAAQATRAVRRRLSDNRLLRVIRNR